MNTPDVASTLRQHLIDPEICIRCNTCEETCPTDAISHDIRNYVVDASRCNSCLACIAPCPTGAIDSWRIAPPSQTYSIAEQFTWDELPVDASDAAATAAASPTSATATPVDAAEVALPSVLGARLASTLPPWSAAHAYTNLYATRQPLMATVTGNYRVTDSTTSCDTHHIVLDFGSTPFPILEGQSIGILPQGFDAGGRPHHARQYSIASPRDGERAGYNNLALTVKRVTADHDGNPVVGVCSNYLCDRQKGEKVAVIGPFGATFLMPNHEGSNLIMICTGTGSAPMRAMTERRRRKNATGRNTGGELILFFGARSERELPYFGPLMNLPLNFINTNLALSRSATRPKRYVQDLMRERRHHLARLLANANTYVYVCGLRAMENGVIDALRNVADSTGLGWDALAASLKAEGRLHIETY